MKHCLIFLLFISVNAYSQSFINSAKPALVGVGNSSSIAFDADKDGKSDLLVMGKTGTNYYTKLYHNNGDTTFLDLGISFPGLAYGSVDVFDFNNDGLLDVVLCGFDGVNKRFILYKNKGNNLFSAIPTSIPGVDYSIVKFADLNNDGMVDIIITGQSETQKIFKIYRNDGNGSFSEASSFEGLYDGSLLVTDINNDTYPDIIASGVTNTFNQTSKIYINNGKNDFSFTERLSNITSIRGGNINSIDFDNDGDQDIVVVGKTTTDQYISQIFSNNNGESFTLFTSLNGLYYSTSAIGDFNNDGFPDIIQSGLDASSLYRTYYYVNNSGIGFTLQTTNLPNVIKGSINPLDLTNDNKLDILISGYSTSGPVANIYNNNIGAVNTKPSVPFNLSSYSNNDSVVLKWNSPFDTETESKGLTYDFYIKRASDGDTIFTAQSNYSTGDRIAYSHGRIHDTSIVIKNLPYGKYYWSVQAVDQSFKGSAFAPQEEFNICHNLDIGHDTSICKGTSITLSAGSHSDVVNWYSSENPSLAFHNGNTATVDVHRNIKVWATVGTSIGCLLSDTINLSMLSLPIADLDNDTSVCIYTPLTLSLNQSNYMGDWSSKEGSVSAYKTSNISYKVLHNDTIYVKITDTNGCINYDTTSVKIHLLPESHLPSDTSSCLNSTILLNAGNPSDFVYWFNSKGEQLSDKNDINYQVVSSEKLSVKITNSLNCTNFDTVSIIVLPLPIVNAGRDTLICPNSSARLGGELQTGSFLYEWTPAMTLDNNQAVNPLASPEMTTNYILKITDSNNCINYDSVTVTINPTSTIDLGGDKYICRGTSVTLGGNPTASGSLLPYSYKWFPGNSLDDYSIANPTASPDTTTLYSLILFAGKCIVDTVSLKVGVWPLPVVIKSSDVVIGSLENTQIWASGGSLYNWEPIVGLNNSMISNPIASPEKTTTYTVFVKDTNSCESSAQVKVIVQNGIFVPNLFTPNGDGKNDSFKVYGTGIDKIHLRVYSSEGLMVYETFNIEDATINGWDGTFHGNQLNAGKYLWVLDVTSTGGEPLLYNGSNKGIITLLR